MLDPRFARTVALMRSTQHEGERAAARAKAETIARQGGMTFDQALAILDRPAPQPRPFDFLAGFDDYMEQREPGWRAKQAAEKDERKRQRRERAAAAIARHGSQEAVLAPCERERLLRNALAPWIVPCKRPHHRWTASVDGFTTGHIDKPSDRVCQAVANAYPLPTTFREAKAELDHWLARRIEIEDALDDQHGDDCLDPVTWLRFDMVRQLAEHVLPTTTLADLHARFAMMRASEIDEPEMAAALFRDLTAMVEREAAQPSNHPSTDGAPPQGANPIRPAPHGQIMDALRADPSRSDRDIARACGCSPTTAGKMRRALGLAQPYRSVHRGCGQTFRMKTKGNAQ